MYCFIRGEVKESLKKPPTRAVDFQLGKTYACVFELTDGEDKAIIYFVGAATRAPVGFPDPSIQKIDLAILCVPSWQYTAGYPEKFIERLRPSYILPSHYNDFFQPINDYYEQRLFLRVAGFKSFLKKIKEYTDYPRFQKIVVPRVNQTVYLKLAQ
jgi:L-ascorbate metabolism protein UlaG (beta-lactamase superfamily)